jgi:tetratricopeptide (TPR) repeat protein
MNPVAHDRLWPVLLTAALVFLAALVVEVAVGRRYVDVVDVAIEGQAPTDEDEGSGDLSSEGPVDAAHAAARTLAQRGMVREAITALGDVADAHPDDGGIRAELGFWLLADERDADGLRELEAAAAADPENAWIEQTLGRARRRTGDLAGSEAAYRKALAARPGYTAAELGLGIVLREAGRTAESVATLEAVARRGENADRARASVALGRTLVVAGRRDEAARAFDEAILLAPADVDIRLAIARAWMNEGRSSDLPQAVAFLDEALRLAPEAPVLHSARARALERMGDVVGATDAYETALRLDPNYTYVRRRLIRLALASENYASAGAYLAWLLDSAGDDPEHQLLAGLVEGRRGNAEGARARYRESLRLADGDYPEAWFNLGLLEMEADRYDEAIAAYEQALRVRPDYGEAANNLALAQAAAGRPEEAERTYRALLERDPEYLAGWRNLASLIADQARYDDAIACYTRALALDPAAPKTLLALGVVYSKADRTEQALAMYRRLVSVDPRYVAGWYNLGLVLKRTSDIEGARQALQQALALDPEHVTAKKSLASLEANAGDFPRAAGLYAELLEGEPSSKRLHVARAEVLAAMGDAAGCRAEAGAALAVDPSSRHAREAANMCDAPVGRTPP